ncbi:MAG: hypothetical protein ACR2MN_13280 [Acidimicrobiales bacterium]
MATDDLGVPEALDLCAWCTNPAHPPTSPVCPAIALTLIVEHSALVRRGDLSPHEADQAPAPPVATQVEHILWDLDEHDPDELPPPF